MASSGQQSSSSIACYAKLVGPSQTVYYLTRTRATLGRRTLYPEGTMYEDGSLVPMPDFFIGDSRNISRIHATLHYNIGDPHTPSYWAVTCHSRNGLIVDGLFVDSATGPFTVRSRSLLQFGDSCWYFLLPNEAGKYVDCMVRPAPVCYVPLPLVSRSARRDEEEREKEREERRKRDRAERAARLALESATAPPSTLPNPLTSLPPPPPPPAISGWSRTERDVIKELAVQWPIARMDKIMDGVRKAGIKRAESEVESFIVTLVAAIMKLSDTSTVKQLRIVVPKAAALLFAPVPSTPTTPRQPPPAPTPLLSSLVIWHSLMKNHTVYSKRITSLYYLHNQMTDRGSLYLLADLMSQPRGRLPALWWDQWCDEDLLLGIYKWGYGRWDEMRADKELRFYNQMEEIKEKRRTDRTERGPGDDGDERMEDEEREDVDEDEDMDEEEDGEEDDEGGDGHSAKRKKQKTSTNNSRSSSPTPSTLVPANVSKGKTADGWPIPLALVGRFRQLLKVMKARDDFEGKKGSGGSRRRLVTKDNWYEDERSVFVKALLMYGGPATSSQAAAAFKGGRHWARVREWWPIFGRHSDESMDKRLEALQVEARSLLSLLNPQQVVNAKRQQLYDTLASLHTDPVQPTLPPHLTPILSHLLLEHLRLFDVSRCAEPPASFTTPIVSGSLPSWWRGSVDDRQLVLYVRSVGWRTTALDMETGWVERPGGGLLMWLREVGNVKGMTALVARWMECVQEWETSLVGKSGQSNHSGNSNNHSHSSSSTNVTSSSDGSSAEVLKSSKDKPQPKERH